MVRQLQGDRLDAWLEDTERLGTAPLRAFAQSLRKDYQAVKAGLTLSWSNGPTEAQIQRLKLLKRQMYWQAGFAFVKGCCGEKQNSRHEHEKANACSNWRPSNQTSAKVAKGRDGFQIPAMTLTEKTASEKLSIDPPRMTRSHQFRCWRNAGS
jgi:Transposase